jgi:hypothetical protein
VKRRRRGRAFVVSFVLTLAFLSGVVVFTLFYNPGISNIPLPARIPAYQAAWARYAPEGALQVSFYNYSLIRQLNSSTLPQGTALVLVRPNASFSEDSIRALVTVEYALPNESIDVAFLDRSAFQSFSALVSGNSSAGTQPSLHFVQISQSGRITAGWLALVPTGGVVEFGTGFSAAQQAINSSLQASNGTINSILQSPDVTQMFYIAGGPDGHVSVGIQNFPGVVRTGQMTLIAVDAVGGQVHVSYVVKFQDDSTARSQLDYMKSSYLSAQTFTEHDQFLQAVETDPFSSLQGDMRLVG